MLCFVWLDRNYRFFVSIAGSSEEEISCSIIQWRQVNFEAHHLFQGCRVLLLCLWHDNHQNRSRQDDLNLGKNICEMDWSQRVNTSVFDKCVVEGYLL